MIFIDERISGVWCIRPISQILKSTVEEKRGPIGVEEDRRLTRVMIVADELPVGRVV